MKSSIAQVRIAAFLLISIPLILISLRYKKNDSVSNPWESVLKHKVSYNFDLLGTGDFKVSTFIPVNDQRQQIIFSSKSDSLNKEFFENENHKIEWVGVSQKSQEIKLEFDCITKPIKYELDNKIPMPSTSTFKNTFFDNELIDHTNTSIELLAEYLTENSTNTIEGINALYNYVFDMPKKSTSLLTSATMALHNNEASCNGKSRLFVALARATGFESRMVGGLILERNEKKTSHAWTEIKLADQWIPFDPFNGYFASLPVNYLKIYNGDHFLITRTGKQSFDYRYHIEPLEVNHFSNYAMLNLKSIIMKNKLSNNLLRALLMLPLGALIVALLKNIIGLKSFGVFLPVLIALALVETGFVQGLVLFSIIIVIISLLSGPLNKWGVQHTPKVVIMLTAVVVTCLVSIHFFNLISFNKSDLALFFPIIVLTLTAERFAQKVDEDGLTEAAKLYIQTLLITVLCFLIVSSQIILDFIITFPETLMLVAGISLLLGKWIGLRVLEYNRFNFQPINQ
ncbi:MAG: hypothetical protein JXQ87_03130 [Bacteroidia bacterium]